MPKSDHLSDFELYVMLAVAALGANAYGVTIATRIGERTGRDVSIGAVYATLGRLADKGFVSFVEGSLRTNVNRRQSLWRLSRSSRG